MAKIDLHAIAHSYNPTSNVPDYALQKCHLSWRDGGRYAVLGPSGCGKTTLLNIMSGIIKPTEGHLTFDDNDVTSVKTEQRNISQVFQFPVIYTTMTVGQNLGFPLVCRNAPKEIITKKVTEVAEILNLGDLLNRRAKSLTADQKQLISLGRGLVRDDVAAILMDEPLTVIDPDLKFRLRRKLKEINSVYNSTLIYVTHDQNEAMTFAEDIVVMDQGRIVQIGKPEALFHRPRTTFVGYFIGAPAMNMFEARISGQYSVAVGATEFLTQTDLSYVKSDNIKLGIRAEFIELKTRKTKNALPVNIQRVDDYGNYQLVVAHSGQHAIKVKLKREVAVSGDRAWLKFPEARCCVYANEELITN